MKKIIVFLLIGALLALTCSCSKDDSGYGEDPSVIEEKKDKLEEEIQTALDSLSTEDTYVSLYSYYEKIVDYYTEYGYMYTLSDDLVKKLLTTMLLGQWDNSNGYTILDYIQKTNCGQIMLDPSQQWLTFYEVSTVKDPDRSYYFYSYARMVDYGYKLVIGYEDIRTSVCEENFEVTFLEDKIYLHNYVDDSTISLTPTDGSVKFKVTSHVSWQEGECTGCSAYWSNVLGEYILENGEEFATNQYAVSFSAKDGETIGITYDIALMYLADVDMVIAECTSNVIGGSNQFKLVFPARNTNELVYTFKQIKTLFNIETLLEGTVNLATLSECTELEYDSYQQSDGKTDHLYNERYSGAQRVKFLLVAMNDYFSDNGLDLSTSAFGYVAQ